jgi:hypothetical protein
MAELPSNVNVILPIFFAVTHSCGRSRVGTYLEFTGVEIIILLLAERTLTVASFAVAG